MFVYRVEKKRHLSTIFEGLGGKNHDFRWNTKGHPIIYASESKSLALHEKGGNLSKPFYGIPSEYVIAIIEIPDLDYDKIEIVNLPLGWNNFAEYYLETHRLGNEFTKSQNLALFVPSSMVHGEFNVLLNPNVIKDHKVILSYEPIDPRLRDIRNKN